MISVNDDLFHVPWREGITVQDALDHLGWDYVLITVTIDGVHVPPEDYTTTTLRDEADLKVIHIAHGG